MGAACCATVGAVGATLPEVTLSDKRPPSSYASRTAAAGRCLGTPPAARGLAQVAPLTVPLAKGHPPERNGGGGGGDDKKGHPLPAECPVAPSAASVTGPAAKSESVAMPSSAASLLPFGSASPADLVLISIDTQRCSETGARRLPPVLGASPRTVKLAGRSTPVLSTTSHEMMACSGLVRCTCSRQGWRGFQGQPVGPSGRDQPSRAGGTAGRREGAGLRHAEAAHCG